MRVVTADREDLGLETLERLPPGPPPGEEGAPLPWIEVAVAWPRKARAEEMLGRLVQLGAAAISPLKTEQTGPQTAPDPDDERLARIAREACKQSERSWLPVLHPPLLPQELALARPGTTLAVLEPRQGMSLDTWARSITPSPLGVGTRKRPIVLAVGPEGGFTEDERAAFRMRGATSVKAAPHVLRIETAAEAALAVVVATMMR